MGNSLAAFATSKGRKMEEKIERDGATLKKNTFHTERGVYRIEIVFMDGALYFVKYKNDILAEAVNLDTLCGAERYFWDIKQKKKDGYFDYLDQPL